MIRTIFKKYMVGDNIVTPKITGYGSKKIGNSTLAYELSKGVGMYGQDLFGLAILIIENNTVQQIHLGGLFKSNKERRKYIDNLTEEDVNKGYRFGKIMKL